MTRRSPRLRRFFMSARHRSGPLFRPDHPDLGTARKVIPPMSEPALEDPTVSTGEEGRQRPRLILDARPVTVRQRPECRHLDALLDWPPDAGDEPVDEKRGQDISVLPHDPRAVLRWNDPAPVLV